MNAVKKKDGYDSQVIDPKKKTGYKKEKVDHTGNKNSENFRSRLMASLLRKKAEIEEALVRLIATQKEYEGVLTIGDYTDEIDDAQREISGQNQYNLIRRRSKELKKIEWLIEKVQNNQDIGICEECGKRIPEERLLIVPESTLCVKCQQELERWTKG
ncbi:MAG: TraR/DksA family transcriptional regulator [Deltaproteobacteria bacterium]|nr:TraR/DksA family transcriptional regulator [Deltaproteobacteria bacterium]